MASTGAGRGAPAPGATLRPMSLQQQQESLRRPKKCVSCGNTAMGKCDFRACGTCCARNKNPCQGHGARQGVMAPAPSVETPVRPPYQWPANPPTGVMSYNLRPPNGHAAAPYMNPGAMMGYRMPFTSPVARMPAPPPPETEAQKEARLEKLKKTLLAAQKDIATYNSLRVVQMKYYADADVSFEDEAFDRYMLNSMLLEEAAGLDDAPAPESVTELNEEDLTNAMLAKYEFRNKEAQRQKLQKVVTKSLQRAKKREGELENMVEIREFNQVGYGRKDTKRMKVQTADGKEYLRRINAWEDLFQEIGSFSKIGDVSLFLDTYKEVFGQDLGHSLPQLIRVDTSQLKELAANKKTATAETSQSVPQHAAVQVGVPDCAPLSTEVPETGPDEQVHDSEHVNSNSAGAALSGGQLLDNIEGFASEQISQGGVNADIPASTAEAHLPGAVDEAGNQIIVSEQTGPEVLTMEQLFAISAQTPMEDVVDQQFLMTEMLDELGGSVEQQTITEQQSLAAQMLEELGGGNQAMEPGEETAHEMTIQPEFEQPSALEQMDVDNDQNAEAGVSNEGVIDDKWLENAPRLPVRRLLTSLIKQKPDITGISCVKVDLEEHGFHRVFCNQHSYSFESL